MLHSIITNLGTTDLISVILTFLTVLYLTKWFLANRQLPPGPYGLPFVGYLPFMEKKVENTFKRLQKKYGDIYSFTLGSRLIVVLGSWDLIKKAFVKNSEIFAGRPLYNLPSEFFKNDNLISNDGEAFNIQKRFLLSSLRDYGFGKSSLEGKIHQETEAMINLFNEKNGKPMDIQVPFNFMTTNVICSIAFGERFDYDDKRMKKLIDCFGKLLIIFGEAAMVEAFPILRNLPNKWNGLQNLHNLKKELDVFVDGIVDEHIRTFDKNNPRDLIDEYLKKMEELGISFTHKESRGLFSRHNVLQNLISTFFAGTETTANTLSWGVALLLNYPEVQEKCQKEIDAAIGRSRLPSYADREQLPYTEATIHEIHRISTILPFGVVHANTEEVYLDGYRIPKRTDIVANQYNVHFDPKLWKDPHKFDPTRFLDSNGKAFKPEYLMPFSVGKRACLGESLAKMEILIFLASFLQNFNFRSVGKPPDYTQAIMGIVRKPLPFEVIVEPRM